MNQLKILIILNLYNFLLKAFGCFYKKQVNVNKTKININKTKNYIWVHASSVGEANLVFPIINYVIKKHSKLNLVVTYCGTLAQGLWAEKFKDEIKSGRLTHGFLPLDTNKNALIFFKKFNPVMALWVEADFWPNFLLKLKGKNIPAILLNGRLSKRSFKRYLYIKSLFSLIISCFSLIIADSKESKKRFLFLQKNFKSQTKSNGQYNQKIHFWGNLKHINKKYHIDLNEKKIIEKSIGTRKVIAVLSSHDPEEEMFVNIYKKLQVYFPDLLIIILPRHLKRVKNIQNTIIKNNLKVQLFSQNIKVNSDTNIFLIDTLGKVALFSNISKITYMGKSMFKKAKGGHNILEPIRVGALVLFGSYLDNFKELAEEAIKNNIAIQVNNPLELENKLKELLSDKNKVISMIGKNNNLKQSDSFIEDKVIETIDNFVNNIIH